MGDNPLVPEIAKWDPEGERIERRREPEYTPPSRARVAQVVKDCELVVRCKRGESPVGVLLRDASERLYKDAVTNIDKSIFPHALLAEVLTEARVLSSLSFDSRNARQSGYTADDCLERICGDSRSDKLGPFARVFTVLLLCDCPQDVFLFFDNNVCDEDFPFEVTHDKEIRPKCGVGKKHITSKELDWRQMVYDSFENYQRAVFLPCFSDESDEVSHQEFTADTIMPWHECVLQQMNGYTSWTTDSTNGEPGAISGGHGFVRRVIIHDGHWNFRDIPQPARLLGSQHMARTFAVKKLKQAANKAAFDKEVAMLRELGGKTPHTVRLLATFCHGGTYSLIFPWAECDLLAYWGRDLDPAGITDKLILWIAKQCHGLVSALDWIHVPGKGVSLSPKGGDRYGRHGDIKPENILWYKEKGDGPHPLASGQLVFSDFGLSDLNHKDSRSGVYNKGVLFTTTYAPPESILDGYKISRAIDVWALGCVFLEFVTWLIGGPGLVREFQGERMAPHLGSESKRDVFWELQQMHSSAPKNAGEYVAVVKPQVVKWIKRLGDSPRATGFIHDFLQIIEKHMLVIKVGDSEGNRARAALLKAKFGDLERKCERDRSYYMAKTDQLIGMFTAPQPEAVSRHLSIAARELINRGSLAIPRFIGQ